VSDVWTEVAAVTPDETMSHAARYLNGEAASAKDFVAHLDAGARQRLAEELMAALVPGAMLPTMLDGLIGAAGLLGLRTVLDRLSLQPDPTGHACRHEGATSTRPQAQVECTA
jgi:hypothetical protein